MPTMSMPSAPTDHNPAPPQPCCCVDPSDLALGTYNSDWNNKFIYGTETSIQRTNGVLCQKIATAFNQGDSKTMLLANAAQNEDPLPLNTVLRGMSSILATQSKSPTSKGLAPPQKEPDLSAETRLAIQRYSNHMDICTPAHTIGIPLPTSGVRIGDVGYVHEKTGQFVRLVNPFDMENAAIGAMKRARGLDQSLLRVCRHPEQRWYPGHYASADVAKLQLPKQWTAGYVFGSGIVDTHSVRKSVLKMRTWLTWHAPLILAVYGPAHGLQHFDLVMVTSTTAAHRWVIVHHPELENPGEIVVVTSGEGEHRRLEVTVPESIQDQVQVLRGPTTGETPEYVVCVSGLVFQCGAVLPEMMPVCGRFFNEVRFVASLEAARVAHDAAREARNVVPVETTTTIDEPSSQSHSTSSQLSVSSLSSASSSSAEISSDTSTRSKPRRSLFKMSWKQLFKRKACDVEPSCSEIS